MSKWKHRLTNIDPNLKTGVCLFCGPVKLKSKKRKNGEVGWRCRNIVKKENKRYPSYRKSWTRNRPDKPCEICGRTAPLVWDHDHNTGKFRGWLCSQCNTGLGMFKDNTESLRKAITYLQTIKPS